MTIIHRLTDERGKIYEISDDIFHRLLGDDDDIVPEGGSVRVPTLLRDGQPSGDSDPRFSQVTDVQRQAVEDARQEYIDRISNAWRNNAAPVIDSTPNLSTRKSTIPQPQPRQPVVKDEREAAYNEYLDYLRNAWHREKEA